MRAKLSINFSNDNISRKTKATCPIPIPFRKDLLKDIRLFQRKEVEIVKSSVLGHWAFGKCFMGYVGPIKACVKVFRPEKECEAYLPREASFLSQFCHRNLPFLYGICDGTYKIIVMSFHGYNGKSCSIYTALKGRGGFFPELVENDWKVILYGLIAALNYIHLKSVLHNDIKNDNVVIDWQDSNVRSVLVDFGKACKENDGRKYSLSDLDKKIYATQHPQLAPVLRDDLCKQSQATDIYSVGRILSSISKQDKLSLPVLKSVIEKCLEYRSEQRPSTSDLYAIFH